MVRTTEQFARPPPLATMSARNDCSKPVRRSTADGVTHAELVPLQAGLELLETIVGEPHRPAVAVERGDETVVRHGAVILRAIADREARVQEQSLQADAALAQHGRRALRHFLRRLRRHDQMQFLLVRIVPAIGVVRLERRGVARLRGVVARQDQPIGGRVRKLVVDATWRGTCPARRRRHRARASARPVHACRSGGEIGPCFIAEKTSSSYGVLPPTRTKRDEPQGSRCSGPVTAP